MVPFTVIASSLATRHSRKLSLRVEQFGVHCFNLQKEPSPFRVPA